MEEDFSEPEGKERNYRRRDFLIAALLTAVISVWYSIKQGYYSRLFPSEWEFLRHPGRIIERRLQATIRDSDDVISNFPPLGPQVAERDWRNKFDSNGIKAIEEIVDGVKKERGWSRVETLVSSQLYGVPESERYLESILRYCRNVERFLRNHESLQGLTIPAISWQGVFDGESYKTFWQGTAFVGHSAYQVLNLRIQNADDVVGYKEVHLPGVQHVPGSVFFFPLRDQPNNWSAYIAAFQPSIMLVTPFTHLIYAATLNQYWDIEAGFGIPEAQVIQGAFSNCIGIEMAREFSSKTKVPRGGMLVGNYIRLTNQQNPLFGEAQTYLSNMGVVEMTKRFTGDPLSFRNELRQL